MTRKSLRILAPIAFAIAVAPFLFFGDSGWRSPCACLAQNELFGRFAGTNHRTLFDSEQGPASVMKGLEAKVRGRTIDDVKGHPAFSHASCQRPSNSSLVCQIWLEKKDKQERGYELSFALSAEEKIEGVKKATIVHRGGA
jgi:hypothetical protein